MNAIIRGTTPSLKYTFSVVNVSEITSAYLTVKHEDNVVVEKSLADATVEESAITWKLTQEETLAFTDNLIKVMCNWKLEDGTRGASAETTIGVIDNQKNEVI